MTPANGGGVGGGGGGGSTAATTGGGLTLPRWKVAVSVTTTAAVWI